MQLNVLHEKTTFLHDIQIRIYPQRMYGIYLVIFLKFMDSIIFHIDSLLLQLTYNIEDRRPCIKLLDRHIYIVMGRQYRIMDVVIPFM